MSSSDSSDSSFFSSFFSSARKESLKDNGQYYRLRSLTIYTTDLMTIKANEVNGTDMHDNDYERESTKQFKLMEVKNS